MRAAVTHPHTELHTTVQDWPDPVAAEGWVVVRVVRAALNRLDTMNLADRAGFPQPAVLGSDAAGVVSEVGPGVSDVSVGEEVVVLPSLWWGEDEAVPSDRYEILGHPTPGTFAEYVTVPAQNVFPKPSRLTWEETAALPLAALTAWRAIVTRGGLRAGETVVVNAASSGVASFVIQIADSLGAKVVAVSSSQEKLKVAESLGAHTGVLRAEEDLTAALLEATDGGAHLVFEPTGSSWPELARALRRGGRMVTIGKFASDMGSLPVPVMYARQLTVLGSLMGSPRDFRALLDHVEHASWRPMVDSVFPLERILPAYARLDDAERYGKVVLEVTEP